jgi:tetratricopeptide (TPR) repeat protein
MARRATEIEPLSANAQTNVAWVSYAERRFEDAVAQFRRALHIDPNAPYPLWGIALSVLAELEERASREYIAGYHLAFLHMPLGNLDEAISCLERACAERNGLTWWVRDSPAFDPLRSHPRFPALLQKIVPA